MFTNPFDSFHNTVSEAKKEREQLDKLLTISTPRERFLVLAMTLVVIALALWLTLGSVNRTLSLTGTLVQPEASNQADSTRLRVVLQLNSAQLELLKPGQVAVLTLTAAQGDTLSPTVKILSIGDIELANGQVPLINGQSTQLKQIDLQLVDELNLQSLEPSILNLLVSLGDQTPLTLFTS